MDKLGKRLFDILGDEADLATGREVAIGEFGGFPVEVDAGEGVEEGGGLGNGGDVGFEAAVGGGADLIGENRAGGFDVAADFEFFGGGGGGDADVARPEKKDASD